MGVVPSSVARHNTATTCRAGPGLLVGGNYGGCIERFSLRGSVWRRVDLLSLARNARAAVEMVEQFSLSNLAAEMNIRLLQGRRK